MSKRASPTTSGRRRRKKAARPGAWAEPSRPNPSLFVGYVEDGETIEMIMKKFERLEEIQQQKLNNNSNNSENSSNADTDPQPKSGDKDYTQSEANENKNTMNDNGLDEETLEQIFRETSAFTVESMLMEQRQDYGEFEDDGWDWGEVKCATNEDGDTMFLMSEDDDQLWEQVFGGSKKRSKKAKSSGQRSAQKKGVTQIAFVSDMHGRFVTGLKKIRKVDPDAIVYQRIPNEITRSWAKKIEPYRPKGATHTHTAWRPDAVTCVEELFVKRKDIPPDASLYTVEDVLQGEWFDMVLNKMPFQGIVLSPPWKVARLLPPENEESKNKNPNNQDSVGIEPEDLLKLGLERDELLDSGFVYIWTPKHLILRVLRVLEKMDLHYVENAVFVKQQVGNMFYCEPSRYFRQSKETLLICRRGKKHPVSGKITWSKVEIRHQRTSDVHFDVVQRDGKTGAHLMPHEYVHNMAETMLPHARFNPLPREAGEEDDVSPPSSSSSSSSSSSRSESPESHGDRGDEGDGVGRLLHLWAPRNALRTGWVMVSQQE